MVRRRKKGGKRKGRRAQEPEPVANPPSFSLLDANNNVSTLMDDENKLEDKTTSTYPQGKFHTHYYKTMFHHYHNNAAVQLTKQYFC